MHWQLHSEVLSLQTTLGISYKDAAHWMFMIEVEQVKKADSGSKLFGNIWQRIDDIVSHEILPPIKSIDSGEWDGYEVVNGKVQEKAIM